MKSIDELIQESINEINTNKKPLQQVFYEFCEIFENRHQSYIDELTKNMTAKNQELKGYMKLLHRDINNIRTYFDDLTISNIKHQLEDISTAWSVCL